MPGGADRSPRVAIIGAGMSGLLMAIKLRAAGIDDFVLFEKETEVGGTWRENIAELQVGYVMQCIFRWQAGDFDSIAPTQQATRDFNAMLERSFAEYRRQMLRPDFDELETR